jgi:hypothetical protein
MPARPTRDFYQRSLCIDTDWQPARVAAVRREHAPAALRINRNLEGGNND